MTPGSGLRFVADEAMLLAKRLPSSVAEAAAERLATVEAEDWANCRSSALCAECRLPEP